MRVDTAGEGGREDERRKIVESGFSYAFARSGKRKREIPRTRSRSTFRISIHLGASPRRDAMRSIIEIGHAEGGAVDDEKIGRAKSHWCSFGEGSSRHRRECFISL